MDTTPENWNVNRASRIYRDKGPDAYAEWVPPTSPEVDKWIAWLWEAGPAKVQVTMSGFLYLGLDWTDLLAWSQCTGEDVSSSDLRAIKTLSGVYASELSLAKEPACPAPYTPPSQE